MNEDDKAVTEEGATLHGDVVGYSRLTADNEIETYNTLQVLRRIIEQVTDDHGGTVASFVGDEFLAVFPDTAPDEAKSIVERIRKRVEKFCNKFQGDDIGKKLSISAGLACASERMHRADELINLADNALYKAKELGRTLLGSNK